MGTFQPNRQTKTYKACRAVVGSERWDRLIRGKPLSDDPDSLVKSFLQADGQGIPAFLPDLVRLEWHLEDTSGAIIPSRTDGGNPCKPILKAIGSRMEKLAFSPFP